MTAMGFKTFLESALENTIQGQVGLLMSNDTPVPNAKLAAGARFSLNAVKSSLDSWFDECVNTARVALTPHVFADFIKSKVVPHLSDIENALLEARYENPLQRSEIKGRWDGFNVIVERLMGLADEFTSLSAAAPAPSSAAVNDSMTADQATEALNASTAPVIDASFAHTEDAAPVDGGSV